MELTHRQRFYSKLGALLALAFATYGIVYAECGSHGIASGAAIVVFICSMQSVI